MIKPHVDGAESGLLGVVHAWFKPLVFTLHCTWRKSSWTKRLRNMVQTAPSLYWTESHVYSARMMKPAVTWHWWDCQIFTLAVSLWSWGLRLRSTPHSVQFVQIRAQCAPVFPTSCSSRVVWFLSLFAKWMEDSGFSHSRPNHCCFVHSILRAN